MKNKKTIIIVSIVIVLLVFGLYSHYIDSARVRNGVEPKFTIRIINNTGDKVTYWGLGYKVIRYTKVSPSEPFKNNRGVKYGSWFMKYELTSKDYGFEIANIVDTTNSIKDFSCAEALEEFYEDDNYVYYFSCIKSEYVIVEYKNGNVDTVEKALNDGLIEIKDLDEYKIDYIKYSK